MADNQIYKPGFGQKPVGVSAYASEFEKYLATAPVSRPEYSSLLDADGNLPEYLKVKNNYDSTYLDSQKAYANSTEDSPWLAAKREEIASGGAESLGALGAQNASGLQEAQRGLSMRQGLTGGASARLQKQGNDEAMFQRQRINQGMGTQNLAATATEEADKLAVGKTIPGLELDKANYDSGIDAMNLTQTIAQRTADRKAATDKYDSDASIWASWQLGQRYENRI